MSPQVEFRSVPAQDVDASCHEGVGDDVDMKSPYDEASLWSHISFSYVRDLLRLGFCRPLTLSDLPPLPIHDECGRISSKLGDAWRSEVESGRNPSLWRALYRANKVEFYKALLYTLLEHAMMLCQPVLLGEFILWA